MKTAFILLGVMVLAGCAEHVKPPITARHDPYVPPQVSLSSDDLRSHTSFKPAVTHTDRAGLLYVTLPIRSASDLALHIDYRFRYFDRTGQLLEQTPWGGGKTLEANVWDAISSNSTSPLAVDFQVDIRYAK